MAAPTHIHIAGLGPDSIMPFARSTTKTIDTLQKGAEDILYTEETGVYNATNNNEPPDIIKITLQELRILQDPAMEILEKKYLWVIQEDGIRIIKEITPNLRRSPKKYVCHTNLTGAQKALQGGELYFCEDGSIYINNKSDRYGCWKDGRDGNQQKNMVLTYLRTIYERVFYLY